jgi:hypothetical protein
LVSKKVAAPRGYNVGVNTDGSVWLWLEGNKNDRFQHYQVRLGYGTLLPGGHPG